MLTSPRSRHRLNRFMALKHGFHSVQEYKAKAQKKFSLLENGILQMPSTRLLLVNVGRLSRPVSQGSADC